MGLSQRLLRTPPVPLKLVILDCDGVLFDSLQSNISYYNAVLVEMGEPPMDPEAQRLCHIYSTPQQFAHIFRGDPDKERTAVRIAAEMDYTPFLDDLAPEPGLHETLARLKARYLLAMATNRGSSLPYVLRRFGLEETFAVVSSIARVERPKPAPDLLLYCLRATGVSPADSVYVGDMEQDRVAAEAAGVPFILCGNNIRHPVRIRRLGELPALLERLPGYSL
ncbi:MAG: HAD-IA family hydrolase [bacterium]